MNPLPSKLNRIRNQKIAKSINRMAQIKPTPYNLDIESMKKRIMEDAMKTNTMVGHSALPKTIRTDLVKREERIGWFSFILKKLTELFGYRENNIQEQSEEKEKDRLEIEYNNNEFIEKSQNRLNSLLAYYNDYKLDILKDVYEYTKIVHDSVVDNKIKPQSLEQFHIYYTDNFLSLFGKIAENNKMRWSLIQKRKEKLKSEILKLKSDIKNETTIIERTETIKKELKKYNEYTKNIILSNLDKKICFDSLYDESIFDPYGEEEVEMEMDWKTGQTVISGTTTKSYGTSGPGGIPGKSGTSGPLGKPGTHGFLDPSRNSNIKLNIIKE